MSKFSILLIEGAHVGANTIHMVWLFPSPIPVLRVRVFYFPMVITTYRVAEAIEEGEGEDSGLWVRPVEQMGNATSQLIVWFKDSSIKLTQEDIYLL
jgi:hypothetical protein